MRPVSKKRGKHRRSQQGQEYRLWIDEWAWCWACGRTEASRHPTWGGAWRLQRAHITSGSGTMRRVEDIRCICCLCPRCHQAQSGPIRWGGDIVTPQLTVANTLWLKLNFDPDRFDLEYLQLLATQKLPALEPPEVDGYFYDSFKAQTGMTYEDA